jgi:excisionase family DNA binding protein
MLAETMTKMYTIKEAADRLNVSYRTVYSWVRDGHITALTKNPFADRSEYMIPEAEIERVERMQRGE